MINKIEMLMKEKGDKNNADLSRNSGIPYTTIDGFYKKGTDKTKYPTLMKLADYFGCSIDFLVNDDITDRNYGLSKSKQVSLDEIEINLIEKFRMLDIEGKKFIFSVLGFELSKKG